MTTSLPAAAKSREPQEPKSDNRVGQLFVYPWMASRNFDLFWFFGPILVALAASVLIQKFPAMGTGILFLLLINAFGVGPAHQGPTWFFYFDKKNREHWTADNKRLFFYFAAPLLVFIASIVLSVYTPAIGFLITTAWSVQHFVQQNFGVTLLYHNKNNNEALPDRNLLLRSLWSPAVFFTAMFFLSYFNNPSTIAATTGGLMPPLPAPKPLETWMVGMLIGLGGLALYDVGRYALDMRRQVAQGARINVPALMFWVASALYFVPFVIPGQRIETLWLIPGTMHWFQYIGLNVILVKEKYKDPERRADLPCGAMALMVVLCIATALFFTINRAYALNFSMDSEQYRFFLGIYFGLANVHYYQDAFFWRFREKFQRESIMPYLLQARNTVS